MSRIRTDREYRSIPQDVRDAARRALDLLACGEAFRPSYQGPVPTSAMREEIERIGADLPVRVRCEIGEHVYVTWVFDPIRVAVVPRVRPGKGRSAALDGRNAWTERANAGKGPVSYLPVRGQGYHGTQDYACRCGEGRRRVVALSSDRRTRLYLEAVSAGLRDRYI